MPAAWSGLPAEGRPPQQADLLAWVAECAALCDPSTLWWCDGSQAQQARLTERAVADGVLIPLNPQRLPGCYLHRSHPSDTARTEGSTFICTPSRDDAGPTNNWLAPAEAYARLRARFAGSMRGRTMYVVPFLMGRPGSPLARVGVELTDSVYVALNMGIMTGMGAPALEELARRGAFTRCLHSVGDCSPERRAICHFPQDNAIWSYGSGYGGNALLGKKCLALRLGSALGRQEGWMAEHMLIMGLTEPDGRTLHVAGAFPSACGKTNLAMLTPPARFAAQGWRTSTVGDDIAWMAPDAQGRLRAVNPEYGYFGVVPGTSRATNPTAMTILSHDTLYTNVALLPDGTVWWEGKDEPAPAQALDWMGRPWTPASGRPAAHPNSRFTAPLAHNPILSDRALDPAGVPIGAILFGARRGTTVPLIVEARDWAHGVYLGATLGSETTAAAGGEVGRGRRDPMAMLPFCGYHMGDYFAHWLAMGARLAHPPRIFLVNWFRRDAQGRVLWPGFGDNLRILKWIADRCHGRVGAVETPLGWMPRPEDVDLEGLEDGRRRFEQAQTIDRDAWTRELGAHQEFLATLGDRVPPILLDQSRRLIAQL
jgi:phosphoenolpyruvate carboxykinase (GTP)